jgi:PEP-CTERM motif
MKSATHNGLLFGVCLFAILGMNAPVLADTIDLTSGVASTQVFGQSYNENRAVDVTVVSPQNLLISSITLSQVRILVVDPNAIVGPRIYDSNGNLVAAANVQSVTASPDLQTITMPIIATLITGQSYRLSFAVLASPSGSSGNFVIPSTLPYIETTSNLRINAAWDIPSDSYPTNPNLAVPYLTIQATNPVPEPSTYAMMLAGLGLIGFIAYRRKNNSSNMLMAA